LIGLKHQEDVRLDNGILVHRKGDPICMSLFGFTSTSFNREDAESFTWANEAKQ
jgi:hypothetical protein